MNDKIFLVALAAALSSSPIPVEAQNDVADIPSNVSRDSNQNTLPNAGPIDSPAPRVRPSDVMEAPSRTFIRGASRSVQAQEGAPSTRMPSLPISGSNNLTPPASYRQHEPTASAAYIPPRRDLGPEGQSIVPHGRRVSQTRDDADRDQIRNGSRDIVQGERDERRGLRLIDEGERAGRGKRLQAEGAALTRLGAQEVNRGLGEVTRGGRDLHRSERVESRSDARWQARQDTRKAHRATHSSGTGARNYGTKIFDRSRDRWSNH